MSSFCPSEVLVFLEDNPGVIDFGATRCGVHVRRFQSSLWSSAVALSKDSGWKLYLQEDIDSVEEATLCKTSYMVFGYTDFESRTKGSSLYCTWAPLTIFVCGDQVGSLRSTYDSKGTRVSGVTLKIDGELITSRCRTLKSARKILRSYLDSMSLS
tara:strand:+ start:580 stop:1047 length:468 start_codon:yes stop_codon:yes gene_type:complete